MILTTTPIIILWQHSLTILYIFAAQSSLWSWNWILIYSRGLLKSKKGKAATVLASFKMLKVKVMGRKSVWLCATTENPKKCARARAFVCACVCGVSVCVCVTVSDMFAPPNLITCELSILRLLRYVVYERNTRNKGRREKRGESRRMYRICSRNFRLRLFCAP